MLKLTMIRSTILNEDEQEVENTCEVWIAPNKIRSFNERKNGKHGTRITFDVGGFAVQETPEEILRLITA